MLERGGLDSSHNISSLSTPMTATSSGIRRPSLAHTCRTSRPQASLHAITPTGLGSDLSQLAMIGRSRSHLLIQSRRCLQLAEVMWCVEQVRDLAFKVSQNDISRAADQLQ